MIDGAKQRGRGPGKRPALFLTSIRIPKYVRDYFKGRDKMREVLEAYVDEKLKQGETNGN